MNPKGGKSTTRPLLVGLVLGIIFGCLIGTGIGLFYAWKMSPIEYTGAFPDELDGESKDKYVRMVVESYLEDGNLELALDRLRYWPYAGKQDEITQILNGMAGEYRGMGLQVEASYLDTLVQSLGGTPSTVVTVQTPQAGVTPPTPQPEKRSLLSIMWMPCLLFIIGVFIIILLLWWRALKKSREPRGPTFAEEAKSYWDEETPPLKSWMSTYTIGMDNFDESFSIETPDGDFLGECGMGISDMLRDALGTDTPRKVVAFDVWLFDKTDIRTLTKVLMSEAAYHDESLRSKISPRDEPVMGSPEAIFKLETTALIVDAKVVEAELGPQGEFAKVKVALAANLKPGVDTSAPMPTPEGFG